MNLQNASPAVKPQAGDRRAKFEAAKRAWFRRMVLDHELTGNHFRVLVIIAEHMNFEYGGEAWAAPGATVGYLAQEPRLDPDKTVGENVEEAFTDLKAALASEALKRAVMRLSPSAFAMARLPRDLANRSRNITAVTILGNRLEGAPPHIAGAKVGLRSSF